MGKCLYCYKELKEGQVDFHPACARKFFGVATAPKLPYVRSQLGDLAKRVVRSQTTLTGVQAKLSLDLSRGMFAAGQLYVALSRVRSLEGLYLSKNVIPQYAHTSREVLTYASEYNNEQQIGNEIESGKAVYGALQHNDYD